MANKGTGVLTPKLDEGQFIDQHIEWHEIYPNLEQYQQSCANTVAKEESLMRADSKGVTGLASP